MTKLQEERRERAKGRAERLAALADHQAEQAMSEVKHIPPGQPILVGHHSEKRHRKMLDRRNRLMDKSLETSRKAERAESAAHYAGTAVLGRDPEAVEELTRQIEAAELERERIKAINKAFRRGAKKGGKDGGFEEVKAWFETDEARALDVAELTALLREGRRTLELTPYEDVPFPGYRLTNLGANIRRIAARIEELRAKREREAVVLEEKWGTYEEDPEADRLRITFSRRLTREEFQSVRQDGFRWSGQLKAFQRHLNDSGRWAAQRVVGRLAGVRLVFADGDVSTAFGDGDDDAVAALTAAFEEIGKLTCSGEIERYNLLKRFEAGRKEGGAA